MAHVVARADWLRERLISQKCRWRWAHTFNRSVRVAHPALITSKQLRLSLSQNVRITSKQLKLSLSQNLRITSKQIRLSLSQNIRIVL